MSQTATKIALDTATKDGEPPSRSQFSPICFGRSAVVPMDRQNRLVPSGTSIEPTLGMVRPE